MKIKEQLHTFLGRDWTLFRAFPRLLVYVVEPLPLARLISLVSTVTVTGKLQLLEGYDHMRVEALCVLCAAGRAVRRAGGRWCVAGQGRGRGRECGFVVACLLVTVAIGMLDRQVMCIARPSLTSSAVVNSCNGKYEN